MKKLLIIGAIALVVVGCVLAAGCTSTSEIPSDDDQIIGTWMNSSDTAMFVINGNLTGSYYKLDNGEWKEDASILWTKNKDGTYYLINGNAKATVTLDPVKGMFTTDSGSTFTKQSSENSGTVITRNRDENAKKTKIILDANANLANVDSTNGVGYIKQGENFMTYYGKSYICDINYPKYARSEPDQHIRIIGFYTEPVGGEKLFRVSGFIENKNLAPYTKDGEWIYDGDELTLYAHWIVDFDDGSRGASAQF